MKTRTPSPLFAFRRCDKIRFYVGRYVDPDVVRGLIPAEFAGVAQVRITFPMAEQCTLSRHSLTTSLSPPAPRVA
jgi:hypothetical protein